MPLTGGGSDGNFAAALGIPTLDGLGADGKPTDNAFIEPGCETCLNNRSARGFGSKIHHSTKQVVERNATTLGKPGSVRCIDFPGRGFQ